jgi:hypothetical protein
LASVDGAKQVEMATWDFADAIVHDVPPRMTPGGHAKANDGSLQELKLLAEQLGRAGFDYSVSTLRQDRATSLAWPDETRVHKGATFAVHRELRGREDRTAVLAKLIGQHGGRVTRKQVRMWKHDQNPPAFRSWSDTMRDRIRSIAKQADGPEAREEMAALLEAVAQEVRRGQ